MGPPRPDLSSPGSRSQSYARPLARSLDGSTCTRPELGEAIWCASNSIG